MQGLTPPDEHVDHVWHRVEFARRQRRALFLLNDGDVPGADLRDRQPLIQEFFFHLVGAIDFVAQHINDRLELGIVGKGVTVPAVCRELPPDRQELGDALAALYAQVRGQASRTTR